VRTRERPSRRCGDSQKRHGVTVDLLGEATVSETESEQYLERYIDLIHTLASEALHGQRVRLWCPVIPAKLRR